jgi:uncharacterized membrane protein YraQ (UPF0718 family)
MNLIKSMIKRYRVCLFLFIINMFLLFFLPDIGKKAFYITKDNLIEMLSIIPPIFILLGLLDVWVERETMMKYMGEHSGIEGGVIAFIMGSAAAGPLYVAFPIAGVLLKKGVKLTNVFIFVGAWSTTKIPMILFEATNLGWDYMLLRLICNIIGIIIIAIILEKMIPDGDRQSIYANALNYDK